MPFQREPELPDRLPDEPTSTYVERIARHNDWLRDPPASPEPPEGWEDRNDVVLQPYDPAKAPRLPYRERGDD